jgi:hypothetical protein
MSQITCLKVGWLVDPVLNPESLQLFTSSNVLVLFLKKADHKRSKSIWFF